MAQAPANEIDASKTFYGSGVVHSDRDRMRRWDEYGILRGRIRDQTDLGLRDDDETRGVVGVGLARILGLCQRLKLPDCPVPPAGARPWAPTLEDCAPASPPERRLPAGIQYPSPLAPR